MIKLTTRKDLPRLLPDGDGDDLGKLEPEMHRLVCANPLSGGDDEEPVQILGTSGDRVIGRMNLLPGRVRVAGQELPILWGSGFVVPPEHRSSGIGSMILLAMQGLRATVGAFGPSQMAVPLYEKLRWVDLVAPRYVLPRRSGPVLDRYLRGGALARVASAAVDVLLRALGGALDLVTALGARGLRVEQVARMPEALEPELRKIDVPAHCPRSVAWVNWVLSASSGEPALSLVKDRDGRVVGYFIVSHRRHASAGSGRWTDVVVGSVKDWMTFDPGAVTDAQLVRLAVVQLLRRDVHAIDVCAAEPEIGAALRRCGFVQMGVMHVMFRPLPGTPLALPEYRDVRAWRFRPADGDYFLF